MLLFHWVFYFWMNCLSDHDLTILHGMEKIVYFFLIFQFGGVQGFKIHLSFSGFPQCLLLCLPLLIWFCSFLYFSLTFNPIWLRVFLILFSQKTNLFHWLLILYFCCFFIDFIQEFNYFLPPTNFDCDIFFCSRALRCTMKLLVWDLFNFFM